MSRSTCCTRALAQKWEGKKKKEGKRERSTTIPVREVRAAQDGGWAGAARSSDEDEF
jgi:hypothetical protein